MVQSDDNEISFAFERLSLDHGSKLQNKEILKGTLTKNVLEAIGILRNKKKKRPDTSSIHELIKRNYNISISETDMKKFIDEMIDKKLIYNKKTDQGLDSFYQNMEMEDEAPLDSSYLSESKNSNNFEEESLFNLTKMLDQSSNPPARDIERPCDKIENITRETVTNEKLALKFEAKISAMKNYIDCELSEVTKKLDSFSESVNQLSKMSDIFKKEHSLLLNENIELLKNELKSKDEMIKSLIDTQTLVLETVKNSKASPLITQAEKEKNHKIVEETPKKQKNVEKKRLLVRNLSPSVVLEDIIETFGLNSTKYLRENCNIELPMSLQNTGHNGYAYIIAPNHVTDELIKLNELKLKGRNLIIEEPTTKPRTLHSNINKFMSPNRYEALASSQEEEENDFEIAGAWNTSDNVRYNRKKENEVQSPKSAKRRGQVVVNKHPENQTSFGKQNTSPGHKTYREAAKSSEATQPYNEKENVLIFSDSIPGKMKMHELNREIKNGKVKHLFFPGATSEQVLQYLDVNLRMYGPKTVIIHVGINDLLNDYGDLNVNKVLKNFHAMIKKCCDFDVRNILLSGLVYCKRVKLSILEKLHLKVIELCSQNNVMYIDNRNIYGMHLYQDNLHLLHSGKRILLNNFISNLNFLAEHQVYNIII